MTWLWQPAPPGVPPQYVWLGALMAVAAAMFAYVRKMRPQPIVNAMLLSMRLATIAVVAVILMGPSKQAPAGPAQARQPLVMLLDISASMLTEDCNGMSRFRYAADQWLAADRLDRLAQQFELSLRSFHDEPRAMPISQLRQSADEIAIGGVSHVVDSVVETISQLPADRPGAAVLLLSDGRDTADRPVQPAVMLAQSRGIPVHTVCLGRSAVQRDLALLAIPMQAYLLIGESGRIEVKVYQVGLDEAATTLHLRAGDRHTTYPIRFDGQRVATVILPVEQHEPGLYEYKVSVDTVDGEDEIANNAQSVFVQVTKKRIRVLTLEADPNWDSKFFAQALRRDERVELTQITRFSPTKEEIIQTRGKLRSVQQEQNGYSQYDVVVLGRGLDRVLTRDKARQLREYVESGGHVVMARGRAFDEQSLVGARLAEELDVIEPVTWAAGVLEDRTLLITPAGRSSPWFALLGGLDTAEALGRLPGFMSMRRVGRVKPAAHVLARAWSVAENGGLNDVGQPGIVWMTYGRGNVVTILGDGLWQWGMLPPALIELDGVYDAFWSNLMRWLVLGGDFDPGAEVALKVSRSSVPLGDDLVFDVLARSPVASGPDPKLHVIDPTGKRCDQLLLPLPGRGIHWRARFEPETVGVHLAVLDTPAMTPSRLERKFNVYAVNLERLATSANPVAMRMLSEQTGGMHLHADQSDQLLERLATQRAAAAAPPRPKFIWDRPWLLYVLLGWAGLEWIARRRIGLL